MLSLFPRNLVSYWLLAIVFFGFFQETGHAGCHLSQSGNWYLSHRESISGPRFDDPLHVLQSRGQVVYESGKLRFVLIPTRTPCEGAGCRSDDSKGMVPFAILLTEFQSSVCLNAMLSEQFEPLTISRRMSIVRNCFYLPIELDVLEHPPKSNALSWLVL